MIQVSFESQLPRHAAKWVSEAIGRDRVPLETESTCNACAMCVSTPKGDGRALRVFNPATKCCAFIPSLPNFLVGMALNSGAGLASEARRALDERLGRPIAVSPAGIINTRLGAWVYENVEFGTSQALRCPHYLEASGQCGIHRYRNAICSTYFCKPVRASNGRIFWDAVRDFLIAVEDTLIKTCIVRLGLGDAAVHRICSVRGGRDGKFSGAEMDGEVDHEQYRQMWGVWCGREREFFSKSGTLVEQMPWSEIERLGGMHLEVRRIALLYAYQRHDEVTVPTHLRRGRYNVLQVAGECVTIGSHAPSLNTIEVTAALLESLEAFEKMPAMEALVSINRDGERLSADKLLQLVDMGVLTPSV